MAYRIDYERPDRDMGWKAQGGYLATKYRKLNEQYAEKIEKISDLFKGCVVHVDGYTDPPADEIRKSVIEHGGRYCQVLTRDVTHIIARVLPRNKQEKITKEKVLPVSWIYDSIEHGKLMNWRDYALYKNKYAAVKGQKLIDFYMGNKEPENKEKTPGNEHGALVKSFYDRSRLHFISTWAQECKQFVKTLPESNGWQSVLGIEIRQSLEKDTLSQSRTVTFTAINSPRENIDRPNFYLHIDLDCFFVSVALRDRPELLGKPVAVAHAGDKSKRDDSMSEIACCSYAARDKGVRNGMLMWRAKKLCPELIVLPYEFENYKKISKIFYQSIGQLTNAIEAVSCDEVYFDVYQLLVMHPWASESAMQSGDSTFSCLNPELFALALRKAMCARLEGCTCTVGIGTNKLLARMATKYAKPNGQKFFLGHLSKGNPRLKARWIISGESSFTRAISASECELSGRDLLWFDKQGLINLPNVGKATLERLNCLFLNTGDPTCRDVRMRFEKSMLVNILGLFLGEKMYNAVRGIDFEPLKTDHVPKSVSVELNYGIRFKDWSDAKSFLEALVDELFQRTSKTSIKRNESDGSEVMGVFGESLAVKLMIRAPGQPVEPMKYGGHGICYKRSKTVKLSSLQRDAGNLSSLVLNTIKNICKIPSDIRGVGLQLHKLYACKGTKKQKPVDFFEPAIASTLAKRKSIDFLEPAIASTSAEQNPIDLFQPTIASTPAKQKPIDFPEPAITSTPAARKEIDSDEDLFADSTSDLPRVPCTSSQVSLFSSSDCSQNDPLEGDDLSLPCVTEDVLCSTPIKYKSAELNPPFDRQNQPSTSDFGSIECSQRCSVEPSGSSLRPVTEDVLCSTPIRYQSVKLKPSFDTQNQPSTSNFGTIEPSQRCQVEPSGSSLRPVTEDVLCSTPIRYPSVKLKPSFDTQNQPSTSDFGTIESSQRCSLEPSCSSLRPMTENVFCSAPKRSQSAKLNPSFDLQNQPSTSEFGNIKSNRRYSVEHSCSSLRPMTEDVLCSTPKRSQSAKLKPSFETLNSPSTSDFCSIESSQRCSLEPSGSSLRPKRSQNAKPKPTFDTPCSSRQPIQPPFTRASHETIDLTIDEDPFSCGERGKTEETINLIDDDDDSEGSSSSTVAAAIVNIFEEFTEKDIKGIVDVWITEDVLPEDEDVHMFVQHLVCLVPDDLCQADRLYRYLERQVMVLSKRDPDASTLTTWLNLLVMTRDCLNECVSLHFHGAKLYPEDWNYPS